MVPSEIMMYSFPYYPMFVRTMFIKPRVLLANDSCRICTGSWLSSRITPGKASSTNDNSYRIDT